MQGQSDMGPSTIIMEAMYPLLNVEGRPNSQASHNLKALLLVLGLRARPRGSALTLQDAWEFASHYTIFTSCSVHRQKCLSMQLGLHLHINIHRHLERQFHVNLHMQLSDNLSSVRSLTFGPQTILVC